MLKMQLMALRENSIRSSFVICMQVACLFGDGGKKKVWGRGELRMVAQTWCCPTEHCRMARDATPTRYNHFLLIGEKPEYISVTTAAAPPAVLPILQTREHTFH